MTLSIRIGSGNWMTYLLLGVLLSLSACAPKSDSTSKPSANVSGNGSSPSFLIAAFNAQGYGKAKIGRPDVLATTAKIVRRYDAILIQDIRDTSVNAIQELLGTVNRSGPDQYTLDYSLPEGRSSVYQERYALFYKSARVTVLNRYSYDDGVEPNDDTFEHEPYVYHLDLGGFTTTLIPLHADPANVAKELDALVDVYADAKRRLNEPNAIFLGDFGASCSNVKSDEWNKIRLKTDAQFTWLIADDIDTTVSASGCAYDRIVVTSAVANHTLNKVANVFDFVSEFQLDAKTAQNVSNHFPVELEIIP